MVGKGKLKRFLGSGVVAACIFTVKNNGTVSPELTVRPQPKGQNGELNKSMLPIWPCTG